MPDKQDSNDLINSILCADWGKGTEKRSVYVADVPGRVVYRLNPKVPWSVAEILRKAELLSCNGPVLATFDSPLGVPESYLAAAATLLNWRAPTNFVDFLACACVTPGFFDATPSAEFWTPHQPFFGVPAGKGGLTSYINAAAEKGVELYRRLDKKTKAKTLFAKSGIPGSVGSATCSLWQEIGPPLNQHRSFRVWPFEGDLRMLLKSVSIVLGEIYPRAAYSTALLDAPPELRPPLALAKTDANVRRSAIEALKMTTWVRAQCVSIEDLDYAQNSEDDFDAGITAAALLRCELEGVPLCAPWLEIDRVEGGMLGTGSMNLELAERTWSNKSNEVGTKVIRSPTANIFRCPITGCDKDYRGSRGGWDGHVGSVRIHPLWHPELTFAEERKAHFLAEVPEFFS